MPGIVGLITRKPRAQATSELLEMLAVMRHESFYTAGTWVDEGLGVYVGWTALEDSFSDRMPLRNETGEVVLLFSGEDFPEPGTRQRLKQRGHPIEAEGPSYLVHLYEEEPAFPACLNGMFHGLLADTKSGTAVLFTDRYRMHRVYYHQSKDAFYFAAEAKAILQVRPELRVADPRSLGEFVACGCVLEDRTLFKGVHVLPGAALWVFRNGSLELENRYFDPRDWEEQLPLEPESYYPELRDAFSRNLPRYLNGPQPVGMSLTGGLDTRVIMAWGGDSGRSVPCYTFDGMYRECRDVRVARRVASACGQSHQVISVGEEFLSRFPEYAARTVYLTDGCADVSRAPDLYANARARQTAPVRLTGLFGDEVFRYNRTFRPSKPTSDIFCNEVLAGARECHETYAAALEMHPLSFSVYRQAPWHQFGSLALERSQVVMRSPFLDNDLIRTLFRVPESAIRAIDYRLSLIEDGNLALRSILTDRCVESDQFLGKPMRVFQEFTFKAEYAYDHGMPQWVARIDHLFSPLHLEKLFLGRHKFYHFRVWYRDALAGYIRGMLLDRRTLSRPYLQGNAVEALVRAHTGGLRNHTRQLHQLLTLELVHRLLLDAR